MFSREVAGWRNVLQLWDIFFDLISTACPVDSQMQPLTSMALSRYNRPGVTPTLGVGRFSLMLVLEATSASMVLLQRKNLLSNTSDDGGHVSNDSDSIHRLMNYPPLKNILPLTATLLSMMRRVQLHQHSSSSEKRKSLTGTFSDLAQTVDKGIRTMWGNTTSKTPPMPNRVVGSMQQQSIPVAPSLEPPQRRGMAAATDARRNSVDLADAPQDTLASTLNDSLLVVKNYLFALENTATGGHKAAPNHVIPQSVWNALEDAEQVRAALMVTPKQQDATPAVDIPVVEAAVPLEAPSTDIEIQTESPSLEPKVASEEEDCE